MFGKHDCFHNRLLDEPWPDLCAGLLAPALGFADHICAFAENAEPLARLVEGRRRYCLMIVLRRFRITRAVNLLTIHVLAFICQSPV